MRGPKYPEPSIVKIHLKELKLKLLKLAAVKTVAMINAVQGFKGCNVRLYS